MALYSADYRDKKNSAHGIPAGVKIMPGYKENYRKEGRLKVQDDHDAGRLSRCFD